MAAGSTCPPAPTPGPWKRPRRGSKDSCGPSGVVSRPRRHRGSRHRGSRHRGSRHGALRPMTVFDQATAVLPAGDGRYEIKPDERFAIVSGDGSMVGAGNGGVLLATVLRAVR